MPRAAGMILESTIEHARNMKQITRVRIALTMMHAVPLQQHVFTVMDVMQAEVALAEQAQSITATAGNGR